VEGGNTQQQERKEAGEPGTRNPARHAKRPRQLRLAIAQGDERGEFEQNAGAGEQDIDGHQPLEIQAQAKSPAQGTNEDGHPGRARARMQFAENRRKHPILGHSQGQARVAHHQSVEHAEGAKQAAEDERQAQPVSSEQPGDVRPGTGLPGAGRQSSNCHGRDRQNVGERHKQHRQEYGPGIGALRAIHFRGDGGGIVPAHVIPHGNQNSAEDAHGGGGGRRGRGQRTVTKQSNHTDDGKRSRERSKKPHRGCGYHAYPGNIQQRARGHHRDAHHHAPALLPKPWNQVREIGNEQRGVDGHIENTGNEREPGFLKAPEFPQAAAHPGVIASFGGDGAGEFADHVGGGQAPQERRDEKYQNPTGVARTVDDVFSTIGAARNHEERGGHQGPEREFRGELQRKGTGTGRGGHSVTRQFCLRLLNKSPASASAREIRI